MKKKICLQFRRLGFNPWVGKIPWRRERLPTPVFWLGEFHGLHSPWGHKESDMTENPMNSMKRETDMTLKDELPRLVDAQYATGEKWSNNSRKNEDMEPKQKQYPVVDVTGDGSKV